MDMIDTLWPWPWWGVMVGLNVCQVLLCIHLYRASCQQTDGQEGYVRWMRIMGLVFTLVAMYRSVFVSRYLFQYAFFDTVANSSLVIRSMAWVAELSFAGLIACAMLRFNRDMARAQGEASKTLSFYERYAPYALVACLFVAQFFATGGLITKSRLLFAIEETLWSAGFFSILPLAIIQFRHACAGVQARRLPGVAMLRTQSVVIVCWCVIYCTYGAVYHLPTEYWATAFEQLETGVPPIKTGLSAVRDALYIVNVNHTFTDWGFGFALWHSAYFTVCVWLALFLMRAPRYRAPQ